MRRPNLSPAEELLLLIAWPVLDESQQARLDELLRAPLPWPALLEQAGRLRCKPLLHHHLAREPRRDRVPPEVLADLERAYRLAAMKNLQVYGALRGALSALQEAGVPVILLKGAFLAQWVYGDMALRPMGDVDILCRKEDEETIQQVLDKLGATHDISHGLPESEPARWRVREHVGHPPPRYLGHIVRLETHFHLFGQTSQDLAETDSELWENALEHSWDGLSAKSLSWEHQVLHLASHLHKHLESGEILLYWVSDLHELLRQHRQTLDLDKLAQMARTLGLERKCQEVFDLLNEPWPHADASFRNSYSLGELLAPDPERSRFTSSLSALKAARHAGDWKGRFGYVLRLVFPTPEHMALRHPGASPTALVGHYFLDPPIRVWILLKGAGTHVLRSLRP